MKNIFIVAGLLLVVFLIGAFVRFQNKNSLVPSPTHQTLQNTTPPTSQSTNEIAQTTVIAQHLDTPWGIVFLPDKALLVTERPGRVRFIDSNGNLAPTPVATLPRVKEIGEGGLLGIALHPDFPTNHFLYLYYTYSSNGDNTLNRVVRMTYTDQKLTAEKVLVDQIPGSSNHNGGRIKFGPDTYLYITTGDAQNPSQAQKTSTLGGKILRVTDTGAPAQGNPFKTQVYSYGHRNPQGLAWDANGNLWQTEHGRSGIQSGFDEINLIERGKNYGWPIIQGDEVRPGMETPKRNSGATTTWAPAGAAILANSLFFGGLRGQTLYEATIQNNSITALREYFKGQFGRIRDVVVGPDNMLYITTSNRDGRGIAQATDDRIIRINPRKL